jgi:hypothetical protein
MWISDDGMIRHYAEEAAAQSVADRVLADLARARVSNARGPLAHRYSTNDPQVIGRGQFDGRQLLPEGPSDASFYAAVFCQGSYPTARLVRTPDTSLDRAWEDFIAPLHEQVFRVRQLMAGDDAQAGFRFAVNLQADLFDVKHLQRYAAELFQHLNSRQPRAQSWLNQPREGQFRRSVFEDLVGILEKSIGSLGNLEIGTISVELRWLTDTYLIESCCELLALHTGASHPPENDHDRILSHAILTGISPPAPQRSNSSGCASTRSVPAFGVKESDYSGPAPPAHSRNTIVPRSSESRREGGRKAHPTASGRTVMVGCRRHHPRGRARDRAIRRAGSWSVGHRICLGRAA